MRALGLSALVLALAVGVAHYQGHIDATSAEQWRAAPARLLAQPPVAAAVGRLRAAAPAWLVDLLPAGIKAAADCACGVSAVSCVAPLEWAAGAEEGQEAGAGSCRLLLPAAAAAARCSQHARPRAGA